MRAYIVTAAIALLSATAHAQQAPAPFPVQIDVDAGKTAGPLKPIWRFFGADEPNYATMKDGRKLLKQLNRIHDDEIQLVSINDGYEPATIQRDEIEDIHRVGGGVPPDALIES